MTQPGSSAHVHFDGEDFHFEIVDSSGEVHEFNLHPIATIELIQEMRREVKDKISFQQVSMRPLLRVLRGGDV